MYETSDRFRQVMAGSHRAVMRARLLPNIQFGANPTGGLEIPIKSGDVKMASTTDVKATLECEVPGDYWDSVRPYGAELFVERGVDYGDGTKEYVPLGYFRIQKVDQASAPAGPIKISAQDRIAQLKDVRLIYPYSYPAGLTHRQLFDRLVNGYTDPVGSTTGGPLVIAYGMYYPVSVPIIFEGYDGDRATLPAGTVKDDVYAAIADIVDARSCVVMFDRIGQMVITSRERAPGVPSIYTVKPGKAGNLVSASRSLTRDGVYNIVVSRGSDPANLTGYRLAYNNDTGSALYWAGPFGPIPRYYSSPLLKTSDQADAAAETVLSRYKGLPSGLATVSLPDPSLDPLDPITVQIGTTLEDHVIDEITIPLVGQNSGLVIKTRSKNTVPTEEDFPPGGGDPGDPGPGGGGTDPGTGTGPPIYAATFPDDVAHPNFTEPASNTDVSCTTSDFATKLAALAPGQTLVLANGTYPGTIQTVSKVGTKTQPIVIRAANPGQAKLASGGGFKLTGKYILVKDIVKEFDDSGKTFSFEGAAEFCGFDGCVVGPATLGAAEPTAAKSLHFYAGGDATNCFFSYCESRGKSKPGNGVLVDGNFTTLKACTHILIDHMDMHDYGTEVVNEFEAIRYGVSTMQTTVVNSTIMRCVFTNIATEPEIISVKANKVESWGHTIQNCIGSLSIRHGDNNFHKDCYVFGPATGAGGTKAGGARVYGKNNEISHMYFQDLNGTSYESTLTIDGGDTTAADSGHQNVVGGKFANNLAVNCATPIVIGEHYTTAPAGITVTGNRLVNCGGTAVKTVKAPTGTNNISDNVHYATVVEAQAAGLVSAGDSGTSSGGGTPDSNTAAGKLGWGTPLSLSDEFDYTGAPNSTKWSVYSSAGHAGNGVRSPSRVTVTNGKMVLTGLAGSADTAGLAHKEKRQYGRWEIRARSFYTDDPTAPGNKTAGYHPVAIIWPSNDVWPGNGEYDFMENGEPGEQAAGAFLHYPSLDGSDHQIDVPDKTVDMREFHNYAIEWTADYIKLYIDGALWYTASGGAAADRKAIQAMTEGQLTIQLDAFQSSGLDASTLEVEWVRVYSLTPAPGGGGTGTTQTLGVGGVATPAGAILATGNTTSALQITSGGTATNPKVYDGKGFTVGRINIRANYVVVQNYRIVSREQYGIDSKGVGITIQNNDIKDCRPTGDGDMNAITFKGDNTRILYNTAINFVGVSDSGSSHTDAIQTWNSHAGDSSSNVVIIGNRFEGPPTEAGGANHIHQAVIGEGKDSTDGGGGGTGVSQNWFIADNYWTADCKFDDIDNVTFTRNTFAGDDKRVVVVTSLSSGFKYYSDNVVTGHYSIEIGAPVIPGPGPANPLATSN